MQIKRLLSIMGLVAVLSVGGATAFALSGAADAETPPVVAAIDESDVQPDQFVKKERPELTDEQKAEMEAKRKEMQEKWSATKEKWDALTQEQKDELYALQEQASNIQSQMIDKQLELGLIDEQTAQDLKDKLAEKTETMKENNIIPGLGGFHGKGRHHGGFDRETSDTDATMK